MSRVDPMVAGACHDAAGATAAPPWEYRQPPAEIPALAEARPPPRALSDSRQQVLVLP
ncbi:hypothetical protein [Rhodanobacter sp. UC4451_H18]